MLQIFVLNYLGQLKFGKQQNKHHFWLIYMSVIIVKWFASSIKVMQAVCQENEQKYFLLYF